MNERTDSSIEPDRRVLVWDLPVRLFHWTLVAAIFASWFTAEVLEDRLEWHEWSGFIVLTLIIFRILWGFTGGTFARFCQFVRGPITVIRYAGTLYHARREPYLGHNPLGGWMVMALLVILLIHGGIGLFGQDDVLFQGPLAGLVSSDLSEALTELHEAIFNVIVALVALHVAAVAFHKFYKGEDLVPPMITGYKELPPGVAKPEARAGNILLALVLLLFSAGIVWGIVQLGG